MSQPEPVLSDRGDPPRPLPPVPPEVDWEAVRRGCPCGTCEAARQGEGAEREDDDDPSAPGSDPGSGAALEARIAALERRLDARLARLESRVDALLVHATRKETPGAPEDRRTPGPLDAAADAIARFVRDVEDVLDDLSGPGRRPR